MAAKPAPVVDDAWARLFERMRAAKAAVVTTVAADTGIGVESLLGREIDGDDLERRPSRERRA